VLDVLADDEHVFSIPSNGHSGPPRNSGRTSELAFNPSLAAPSREHLKHLLSKLIARMAMKVEGLCAAASILSFDGRNEINEREGGFMIREARLRDPPQAEDAGLLRHAEGADVADGADNRYHAPTSGFSSDEERAEEGFEPDHDLLGEDSEEIISYQSRQQQPLAAGGVNEMLG
jgi:hypothetical protein